MFYVNLHFDRTSVLTRDSSSPVSHSLMLTCFQQLMYQISYNYNLLLALRKWRHFERRSTIGFVFRLRMVSLCNIGPCSLLLVIEEKTRYISFIFILFNTKHVYGILVAFAQRHFSTIRWSIFIPCFLQVVILHHMLSKAAVKARPSVLWCYKKELGFSRWPSYSIQYLYIKHIYISLYTDALIT